MSQSSTSIEKQSIHEIHSSHFIMDNNIFSKARSKLGKTQRELAELLGVSLKAVQSYEQGWRSVPLHVERQMYFLLIYQRKNKKKLLLNCWNQKNCPYKEQCPAWEFQAGHLCWFLSGTMCECTAEKNWKNKIEICRKCEILSSLI